MTYSVAPAEGQRPLFIMTDPHFEELSNPQMYPLGSGGYDTDRIKRITYRKYFNQRLLDVDGRFARDVDYIFVSQYIVESKQVNDDSNHYIYRQKPHSSVTAGQIRQQNVLQEHVRQDVAYRFLKNVRGSPPYYQRTFNDLLAMIRQLGTPTWFLTLSAADLRWPDMICTIARQYGTYLTEDDVSAMTFDDRANWISRNPVTAARHFQYRLDVFFNEFLKSSSHPIGEVSDYAIRVEFQARGSPHAHTVIWVKDSPKYGINSNEEICSFIDKYVSCSIPSQDSLLKNLILTLQTHRHSTYCRRNKTCRFRFPQPPCLNTLISTQNNDSNACLKATEILRQVRTLLSDKNNTDLTLNELLAKGIVDINQYNDALAICKRDSAVVLKRKPSECMTNNYNPAIMLAWQANMDLQFVLNAYACVMYVASYIMKSERHLGVLLKQVSAENRTEDLLTQLRKVGSAFLTHREVSAQEAVYRILSLPMKRLSRQVIFVNTNPKHQRIAVLKDSQTLSQLHDDDTNVFHKNLIERYQHRPHTLASMCLAEFAATYAVTYRPNEGDDPGDVIPTTDESSENTSTKITLLHNFGKMHQRRKQAIIRFTKYNKESNPSNYYRSRLMLYYPWRDEENDILGNFASFEEHYDHVITTILTNENKYTVNNVDDLDIDEDGPPEHVWDSVAPNTESERGQQLQQGHQLLTDVTDEDLADNAQLFSQSNHVRPSMLSRFEAAANAQEISPHRYRNLVRNLNTKQRQIIMHHRRWCKTNINNLRQGLPPTPFYTFLSGPGGVGKSHVIEIIHSDTIKLLRLSGSIQPDDVIVLLAAPTGVAAFNIKGITLHSALLLGCGRHSGFQPLSHDRLNTLRTKISILVLLIIDEVSMVGSNMLFNIHKRLQQIKGTSPDILFGGVSILAVGDLHQLSPVGQPPIFNVIGDSYASLYRSGSLWKDEFQLLELDEVMR
jgi:hypothetical protein